MAKISVIIPVYNVERYLKESLDSIANQTLGDIEIICINDGSTDDSLNILKEYQNTDSRIKIITQENRGAGASRNLAISKASGKYVYFMDADDYLELDAFEKIYSVAEEKSVDFLMFKISNFNEDTSEIIDDDYYNMPHLKEIVGENSFSYSDVSEIALNLCVCPPGNLFNREFISDIRFPEGLLFEDNVFFTHALFKASRICFLDEFLYHRRRRSDSTTTPISVRSMDTIDITDLLLDLCREYGHDHRKELYYRIFHNIYAIFKKAESSQKQELFDKIRHDYLKHKDKWEKDDYFKDSLNPKYRHMFNCAIKSRNAGKFESCVDNYSKESKFQKLRKRLL